MKIGKKTIESFFYSRDYSPMVLKEIYKVFNVRTKENRKKIRETVKILEKEGKIFRDGKGRYRRLDQNLRVGTIEFTRSGTMAFVITDEYEEIAVPVENAKNALHRDRVVVEIVGKWRDLPKGKVVKVIERKLQRIVGVFEKRRMFGFVIPDDPKILQDFYVAPENINGAKPGQKVIAKIVKYPSRGRNPEVVIEKVLGDVEDPSVDLPSIIVKHDLPWPGEFPPEVLKEANEIPLEIPTREYKSRRDFRDKIIVTIDGEDAKDFDDAITVEKKGENYVLGVHIADVSHYVKEGSALDEEAYKRGTSVYLIDTVIPMLPFRLSNGVCSLVEGEDRLVMSVEMEIDSDGKILKYWVGSGVIRSKKRLTYGLVNRLFEGDKSAREEIGEDISRMLMSARELMHVLREARRKRGAIIDIESDEVKVVIGKDGSVVDIMPRKRGEAEVLIEEFMIKANETVAEIFYNADLPFVYRVHEEPDPSVVLQLKNYLAALGIEAKFGMNLHPGMLQKLLEEVGDHPLRSSVERLLVRSMKRAMYSAVNIGHFGLASYAYTHFTSPIRRYPDLVVHRLLRKYLKRKGYFSQKETEKLSEKLSIISKHCSKRERVADEAEWDLLDMKKVEYISRHIGEVFDVVVTNVTKFGLFVEIPEKLISGLVHISTMDDYYYYDDKINALVGSNTGKIYKIGDQIRAKVVRANKVRMEVDFVIADDD